MDKFKNDELVEWDPSQLLEITLAEPDDFLKVKETLTRIGISSRDKKYLYQTCHILHKRGRYYIMHFKELFLLDRREDTQFTVTDLARRNTIAQLLLDWGLIESIVDPSVMVETTDLSDIKVIPFKEKPSWRLIPKYAIGVRK